MKIEQYLSSKVGKRSLYVYVLFFVFFATSIFAQDHKSWSYNLNIYEVNTRQYTVSGTFNEFKTHLDRLKNMGVGIIWFMPIHPTGSKNRLGTLGSPYSVKDYFSVNPEYGTFSDFKSLVDAIHAKGMYVIIDWVANHTAWDNVLTTSHPEWYVKNASGNFTAPPGTNWSDVIQLDFTKQGLRDYMTDAMAYWINEAGIDGFRCDAVSFVPTNFWSTAIAKLKTIKPNILMLAEDDGSIYQYIGFDMSYAWGMYGFGYGVLKRIASGSNNANDFEHYMHTEVTSFEDHYRMYFTSNHDENSWYGTDFELFGNAAPAFAALTATINSMQLVYGGEEAGLNKRLAFFDKDRITWQTHSFNGIYTTLSNLKKENQALWNGIKGGFYKRVNTSNNQNVFSFVRKKDNDKILAVFNLSSGSVNVTLNDTLINGTYSEVFSNEKVSFTQSTNLSLQGWDYKIYKKINSSTGIEFNEPVATNFNLDQNYPNPFNPETTISFTLPENAFITLKVFDVLGTEVADLFSGNKNSGKYEVTFNAKYLPSGIYFFQLSVPFGILTKKMILLK